MSETLASGTNKKSKIAVNESANKAVPKNITANTARRLSEIKKEINTKPHGRSIRDSEILEFAINQIKPEHFISMKEMTLSPTDRLQIRHEEYQALHGEMSLDEFVRRLVSVKLQAEVGTKDRK